MKKAIILLLLFSAFIQFQCKKEPVTLAATEATFDYSQVQSGGVRMIPIKTPTLMIGAKYDTMDPAAMEAMSKLVQKGRYLYCPEGSHLSMWDDQSHYYPGVIQFIKDVDGGKI